MCVAKFVQQSRAATSVLLLVIQLPLRLQLLKRVVLFADFYGLLAADFAAFVLIKRMRAHRTLATFQLPFQFQSAKVRSSLSGEVVISDALMLSISAPAEELGRYEKRLTSSSHR